MRSFNGQQKSYQMPLANAPYGQFRRTTALLSRSLSKGTSRRLGKCFLGNSRTS